MLKSKLYFVGGLIALLCVAGFSEVHVLDSAPEYDGQVESVVLYPPLLLDDTQPLTISVGMDIVCILPGDASRGEKGEFADCIADAECEDWNKNKDSNNGNVSMVCKDE